MKKTQDLYLQYIPEFDSYGIKKEVVAQLSEKGIVAKILLPKNLQKNDTKQKPTIGFLLGQDKSDNGVNTIQSAIVIYKQC